MNFDQAFDKLISHEGGYVNNPKDPGGETKFGISKQAYPDINIAELTLDDAKKIYLRDYWDLARCSDLPQQVAFQVFDTAVNSGISQSTRFLQRAVGVADDGIIGPLTIAAVYRLQPDQVAARFNGQRLAFMAQLSTWDTFGKGWARRVAQNLMEI